MVKTNFSILQHHSFKSLIMTLFWILWGIDVLVALIIVCFFIIGLGDGSVSSFNGALWFGLLIGLATLLGGSWWLKSCGKLVAAKGLLSVVAIPAVLFFLFFLLLILSKPRWN
jgi:hypothetical protein